MRETDYRYILDFFFSEIDVTDELKRKFSEWLRAHGDEPRVKELLEEYWIKISSASSEFDVSSGLESLMSEICPSEGQASGISGEASSSSNKSDKNKPSEDGRGNSRTFFSSKLVRFCVGAVASIAFFLAGAGASKLAMKPEKQMILMASSENISSYKLPDGSKVWLNKDSWLKYDQDFDKTERRVMIDGEGYFEVAKDSSRPFIVGMPDGQEVKVLGTTFNVCSYSSEGSTEVVLRSGSVQISGIENYKPVILKPDQKFFWANGVAEISYVNAQDCCRWYERKLVFDNVMLGDILETLSHRCHIRIICRSKSLAAKRMSLTVKDEPVNETLDVLSILLPAEWALQGDQIIIDNKTKKH